VQRPTFDNIGVNTDDNLEYVREGSIERPFDSSAELEDFAKRNFDKIGGYSSLGGLQKRVFDRIGGASSLGGLHKKSSSEISGTLPFEERSRRAFDRIGGMSSFGGFNKKAAN